jgi:DNA-binding beta-propeller fold protein YncE
MEIDSKFIEMLCKKKNSNFKGGFIMLGKIFWGLFLVTTLFLSSAQAGTTAYVVNSYPGDETLSRIDLTTGVVVNNILNLGASPNQIVIKGDSAYVVNSLDHDIQVIDLVTETTVGYINIDEPRNPFHMTFVDSQYAYVTNWATNTISKVDIKKQTVAAEYGVGRAPQGILRVGNKLYICCTGFSWTKTDGFYRQDLIFDSIQSTKNYKALSFIPGRVYVFDLETEMVVDSILVGLNPQYLDLDPEGELNVVCTGDYGSVTGKVYRIDTKTNIVIDSITTGGTPGVISIGADGIGYLRD